PGVDLPDERAGLLALPDHACKPPRNARPAERSQRRGRRRKSKIHRVGASSHSERSEDSNLSSDKERSWIRSGTKTKHKTKRAAGSPPAALYQSILAVAISRAATLPLSRDVLGHCQSLLRLPGRVCGTGACRAPR